MIWDTYLWYVVYAPVTGDAGDVEPYIQTMREALNNNEVLYTYPFGETRNLQFDIRPSSAADPETDTEAKYILDMDEDLIKEVIFAELDASASEKEEKMQTFFDAMTEAKIRLTDARNIINISNEVWKEITEEIYDNINSLRSLLGEDDNYYRWPLPQQQGFTSLAAEDLILDIRYINRRTSKNLTLLDFKLNVDKDLLINEILPANPNIPRDEIEDRADQFMRILDEINEQYQYIELRKTMTEIKDNTISLGLDLAGGLHFELDVDEDSFRDKVYEDLRDLVDEEKIREQILLDRNIDPETVKDNIRSRILVDNPELSADNDYLNAMVEEQYNILMEEIEIEVQETLAENMERREEIVEQRLSSARRQVLEILQDRINKFAVSEVDIGIGQGNRIYVEIPGTQDKESTKRILTQAGNLNFHLVREDYYMEIPQQFKTDLYPYCLIPYGTEVELLNNLKDAGIEIPSDVKFFPYIETDLATGVEQLRGWIPLEREPSMGGDVISDANVDMGGMNQMQVQAGIQIAFKLRSDYVTTFAQITQDNVGRQLAIVLDGNVRSYPRIQSAITGGSGVITGQFTLEEAEDIAKILKAAILPASLIVVHEEVIGPSRGHENIEAGKLAAILAFIAVIVFMILYYKFVGIIASLAVIVNLFITIAVLAQIDFTLSLPGIFGIILTVGMSVDANVIINERIKEELRAGKGLTASIDGGYKKAFSAIIDANLTTILAALVLWVIGTGIIKGFGITLFIGIVSSMLTALFMTRFILDVIVDAFKLKKIWI